MILKDIICLHGTAPVIERSVLSFERLPKSLENKTLLLASDIHYGGLMNNRRMSRIIDSLISLNPDIITLCGDYADKLNDETEFIKRHLPRLKAPLGVYCVPGNNDWETVSGRYGSLKHMFAEAGAKLLVNERASLDLGGCRLVVTGIDDCKCGSPNRNALRQRYLDEDFNILLSHSPAALDRVLSGFETKFQLIMCGHTHGGQLRIGNLSPYSIGFESSRKYKRKYFFVNGEHEVNGMKIIVSNGIGCSILPLRIGARPQVHLFTLVRRV